MKKLFKKAFITGAIMAMGLAIGFAASTALQNLDQIKSDFDRVVGMVGLRDHEIGGLNNQISDLQAEIEELKQSQNNSGKQERIKGLEEQVEGLIIERDNLLSQIQDQDALEAQIQFLADHTQQTVSNLGGN